ncbi:MAG: helix-turn-helix domain-containing protein [Roseiflexaceae bacterium]|nr:helix-turn-helix domain-containing protein [Roseiflexaceae bacterium]
MPTQPQVAEELAFGQWLKRRRQAMDLTQDQLAELVGYASPTLRKIERGERRPSRAMAERLAVALEIASEDRAAFLRLARAANTPAEPARARAAPEPDHAAIALPLLLTRIQPPPLRASLVLRPRLTARLAPGQAGVVTLLVAPAGWGKTTLVRAWLANLDRVGQERVAWLTLDSDDSDPAAVLRYLIAAIQRVEPACGASALALLESQQPALEVVLRLLVNDLATLMRPLTLILDDYHLLRVASTHQVLIVLVEHLPPTVQLIIATREDPPLPLTRLRARRQLAELRAADLRFTHDEATALLNEVMGLTLDQAAITALEQRTEGWATGLLLAALALRERHEPESFVRDFSGSHRLVLDYLAEEVLDRLPAHLLRFLLQTAILERLCGPLCDAVVLGLATNDERPTTNKPDADDLAFVTGRWSFADSYSQRILDELERSQLFLIPLDATRTWYRYHHLFGEVIRARLLGGANVSAIRELHGRAATWYTSQGLWHAALRHALAAQQWELAAGAVEQIGEELMLQQAVGRLRQLIDALPEALRASRPRLLLLQGLCELRSNNFAAAQPLLAQAAAGAAALGDPAMQGEALLHLSDSQRSSGDFAAAHAALQAALQAPLPPRARVNALISRIYEALAVGDWRSSNTLLDQSLDLVLGSDDRRLWLELAINTHSLLLVLPGRTAWAKRLIQATLPWPEPPLSPLRAALLWIDGYTQLLRGALAEAAALLEQSLQISAQLGGSTKLQLDAGLQQAVLTALRGDLSGADRQLAALLALLDQPALAVYAQVWGGLYHYFHGWIRLHQGRLAEAQTLVSGEAGLSPTAWPTTHCARLMLRGLVALDAGDRATAEDLLHAAAAEQVRFADAYMIGDARMPLAYAALGAGRAGDALEYLRAALDDQVARGTPGVLLLTGAPIAVPLLRLAHNHRLHQALAERLLRALGSAPALPAEPPAADPDALTAREREVLHLLARGTSNQAIANTLVISLPTAKTHVARILAKLGVANRTEAIAIARERGLL